MPPLAVCAVDDDPHVGHVVAVARWLEASRAFTPRYLHVARGVTVTAAPHAAEPLEDPVTTALVPDAAEVLAGGVATALERRADELGAALFVVGSRGRPVLVARQGSAPELGDALLDRVAPWLDVPRGVTQVVSVGPPASELREVAREHRSALLVVGCRGLGLFGTMMDASVSRTLVREACGPLVVVPLRHPQ